MPRTDRLFELIQILRAAKAPLTGAEIAQRLEVSLRTVYRDIAALQAMRTPIEGAPGIGYVLRRGYDLPPLNLDIEEAEAVTVGLSMIARTGDAGLRRAADRVARKLSDVAPATGNLRSSAWGAPAPVEADLSDIRAAVRDARKLSIRYRNAEGAESERIIWPLAVVYFTEAVVVAAWCEWRQAIRHFRPDRMLGCRVLEAHFGAEAGRLRDLWQAEFRMSGWRLSDPPG